jgi:shikimate kinase
VSRSNIVLTGFMCAGKTTVGRLLGSMTGREFFDTDIEVEVEVGSSIAEMFDRDGEALFREKEHSVIQRATARKNRIIALGGGAVLDPRNVEAIRRTGIVYLLDVSLSDVLARRTHEDDRPLLAGKNKVDIADLFGQRREAYVQAADVILDTRGKTAEEIASGIENDFALRCSQGGTPEDHDR